jgi:predicted transcriptional regulator
MSKTVQLNTRVDPTTAQRLDALATATGRTKARLFHEAIIAYVESEMQFIEAIERGRADAHAGRVRDFEDYAAELKSRVDQHRPR